MLAQRRGAGLVDAHSHAPSHDRYGAFQFWDQHFKEKKKQMARLRKIAKKMSPEGRELKAAIRQWLSYNEDDKKMRRAAGRIANRALGSAFNTWAADIMGQRDLGGKLRGAIKKSSSDSAACQTMKPMLATGGDGAVKGSNKGDEDGNSALHWACRRGFTEAVSLLIAARGQVDLTNEEGSTPLHWAARKDHAPVVALLLEAGASAELENRWGKTPTNYAKFLQMHSVIALLDSDEGARKEAAAKAQKGKADAAAKAQLKRAEEEKLAARKAQAKERKASMEVEKAKVQAERQKAADQMRLRRDAEKQLQEAIAPLAKGEQPDDEVVETALRVARENGVVPAVIAKAEQAIERAKNGATAPAAAPASKQPPRRAGAATGKKTAAAARGTPPRKASPAAKKTPPPAKKKPTASPAQKPKARTPAKAAAKASAPAAAPERTLQEKLEAGHMLSAAEMEELQAEAARGGAETAAGPAPAPASAAAG